MSKEYVSDVKYPPVHWQDNFYLLVISASAHAVAKSFYEFHFGVPQAHLHDIYPDKESYRYHVEYGQHQPKDHKYAYIAYMYSPLKLRITV